MEKAISHPKFNRFMKKLLSILVFGMASHFTLFAQPSFMFSDAAPCPGEQFCIDVTVKDFTDILSTEYTIQYDPEMAQFTGAQAFGLPNLGPGSFMNPMPGIITVDWEMPAGNGDCTNPNADGAVLDDGSLIYQICFEALGSSYGEASEISIISAPLPIYVTRENTQCNNIGLLQRIGIVTSCVRPVRLHATQETAFTGDLVCVDYFVTGFDNLTSMQFSVTWDPAVLQFNNVIPSEDLINLAASSFGVPGQGSVPPGGLTLSWSYFDEDDPGVDLPDSTVIFTVCYNVIGPCESSSVIGFSGDPTPIEVTNVVVEGFELPVFFSEGGVTVGECDPTGLQVSADCGGPYNINDEFCVQVFAGSNWQSVSHANYLMSWSKNLLQFTGVNNVHSSLTAAGVAFNADNADNGFLRMAFQAPITILNVTVPQGTVLYEVCFKVTGIGGDSPFNFVTNGAIARISSGPNIGLNPSNCVVPIIQPDGVSMVISDGAAAPGEETCLDVAVSNFDSILNYQFSLSWEPNHMQFTGIQNINLPEATISNFGLGGAGSGSVFLDWDPSTYYSLPDGTVIFQICFEPAADASPQDCDLLSVVDLPREAEAISANSNGNNIGIITEDAELCVLFPEGFGIEVSQIEAPRLDTACVEVVVQSFDNITSADFCINWDPTALEYLYVDNAGTWPGLTDANIDDSPAGVGELCINWSNPGGSAIPDGTVVFDICFFTVGEPRSCGEITLSEDPASIVQTLEGEGSLVFIDGEVCILDRYIIEDTIITPVSCPGASDGMIQLLVSGGSSPRGSTWLTSPQQFSSPTPPDQPYFVGQNLPAGPVTVIIFDNANPALIDTFTFIIPVSGDLPEADAGDDKVLGCNPSSVLLSGSGSQGSEYSYEWYRINPNNGQLVSVATTTTHIATATGQYVFEVTNENGCSIRDTMEVTEPELPIAHAGDDLFFDCLSETQFIGGDLSSTGPTIAYTWTALEGGDIVAGTEDDQFAQVNGPGVYEIRVRITTTGCAATDTVEVIDDRVFPNANIGPETVELGCGAGAGVELNCFASDNDDPNVIYLWEDINGNLLSEGCEFTATQTGPIVLVAFNEITACVAKDTAYVVPNQETPQVSVGEDQTLTCTVESVILNGSFTPDTIDFTFTWVVLEGSPLTPGTETTLEPETTAPGVYVLEVTNTENMCTGRDTVQVFIDTIPPVADAGQPFMITCDDPTGTLDGSGSDQGDEFDYIWTFDNNGVIDTIATGMLQVDISQPGTYCLEVINTATGCVSTDCVEIDADGVPPTVIVPEQLEFTCDDETLTITAEVQPANPAYIIEWTKLEGSGNIIPPANQLTIQVDGPGIFQISVVDPANGCQGVNEVVVEDNRELPEVNAGPDKFITCVDGTVLLEGSGANGPDFQIEWMNIVGGELPDPNNTLSVEVSTPGTYVLTILNTANNCSNSDTVEVADDRVFPDIPPIEADLITCTEPCVTLDASGVNPSTNITVTWNGLDGGVPNPANALITEVCSVGDYELIIVDNANGCESRDTIRVDGDTSIPQVMIAEPEAFSCAADFVTLDASATGTASNFTSITWSTTDGGSITPPSGELVIQVDAPGTYVLTVVDQSGCEGSGGVTVVAANDAPVADAGEDFTIGCGETANLDGTGSSQGAEITYQWTGLNTANPEPPNAIQPQISTAGTFQLVVTNTTNLCTDTATVTITFDVPFDPAQIEGDFLSTCTDEAVLTANLPDGTTGMWSTSSGAVIDMDDMPVTMVSGLAPGENVFYWSLSAATGGCDNYSRDSIVVFLEQAPVANGDVLEIGSDVRQGSVNVVANDDLGGASDWIVTVVENPSIGQVTSVDNGVITIIVPQSASGVTQLTYQICNANCENLCSTAVVNITILPSEGPVFRPNTITPNGDGLNDVFIFDELLGNTADKYPDNELIIFNRWGDIVFQVKPYNNDWGGLTTAGQPLPHGTYYYILRLDISNGVILRGDITVLDSDQ